MNPLFDACNRVVNWLDKLAAQADKDAESRFVTIREAAVHDAKNFRAVAESLRSAIRVSRWQAIESAFKDNIAILGWGPGWPHPSVMRWSGEGWERDGECVAEPTHWVRLPEEPEEDGTRLREASDANTD